MTPSLLNPPVQEPVSLSEARNWLRLDGRDEDDVLLFLIAAARRWAEAWLQRVLVAQDWRIAFETWPAEGLALPIAPVRAVSSVRLIDHNGAALPLAPSAWRYDSGSARLFRFDGAGSAARGEIDVAAGYGQPAQVPQPIRQAILLLVAHLYAHRGDEAAPVPGSVGLLLSPYRRTRIA